jgi:hypothetical protein
MTIDIAKARALCERMVAAYESVDRISTEPGEHGEPDWKIMREILRQRSWAVTEFDRAARALLPEALDEIERLRRELAMWRANDAVADAGNTPVHRCWNGARWYQLRWNGFGWIAEGIL